MFKHHFLRYLAFAWVFMFALLFGFTIEQNTAQARRHYDVWDEIRYEGKRGTVRLFRRTWREYENEFIRGIRERNRAYRERRYYNRNYYDNRQPKYVYVITANSYGNQNVIGTIERNSRLDDFHYEMLQKLTNAIHTGEAIYFPRKVYADALKRFCEEAGIPYRIKGNYFYVN